MQTDGYVTAAKLKDAYLGIGVKQETLLKLFEQHNAEFEKKVGHSRVPEARLFFTSHNRGGTSILQLNCLISPSTVIRHIKGRLPFGFSLPFFT